MKTILDGCTNIKKAVAEECPEITILTRDNSSVVCFGMNEDHPAKINPLALCDVLGKHYNWHLNKIQMPVGTHISLTMAAAKDWRSLVDCIK